MVGWARALREVVCAVGDGAWGWLCVVGVRCGWGRRVPGVTVRDVGGGVGSGRWWPVAV